MKRDKTIPKPFRNSSQDLKKKYLQVKLNFHYYLFYFMLDDG